MYAAACTDVEVALSPLTPHGTYETDRFTRFRYLSHMRCHSLCMHAQLSSGARGTKFGLSPILPPYIVSASSEGSSIWASADRIDDLASGHLMIWHQGIR